MQWVRGDVGVDVSTVSTVSTVRTALATNKHRVHTAITGQGHSHGHGSTHVARATATSTGTRAGARQLHDGGQWQSRPGSFRFRFAIAG